MLTFIKLDDTHILYGDVIIHKEPDKAVCFYGPANIEEPYATLIDNDNAIWYGLCAMSINLPRQKDGE